MNQIFASFFLLVALGALWRFIKGVPSPETVRKVISSLVINLLLPMLTFYAISSAPIDHMIWKIPLIGIVVTLACLICSWLLYTLIKYIKPEIISSPALGSIIIGSSWCNATYLGLPIITGIVGLQVAFAPLLYDLLALTPLLWIFGIMIADYYAGSAMNPKERIKHALTTIASLPPIYAVVIALILRFAGIELPSIVMRTCELAGKAVPPIMMLSVGMALSLPSLKSIILLFPATIIRLLFAPMIAGIMIGLLHVEGPLSMALTLEAGMPTMVLTLAIADNYGLDSAILAQLIAITTVLSLLTLPIII